jgi:hypothetical protein
MVTRTSLSPIGFLMFQKIKKKKIPILFYIQTDLKRRVRHSAGQHSF